MRIGILGGMFDPVHNGHLSTAVSALEEFEFDELRLLPCGNPVHRSKSVASDQDRITMLKLALVSHTDLLVDERECVTPEPSYTINSLESLRAEFPQAQLFLFMGMDGFNSLNTWHRWQALFDLANVVVITRPGWTLEDNQALQEFTKDRMVSSIEQLNAYPQGKILNHSFKPVKAGSTEVRALIKKKESAQHLLPEAVWSYIKTHHLYA